MLLVTESPTSVSDVDDEHAPRLYAVKRDGAGGLELLRQRDVVDYVTDAERDPDSVVVSEQLPDCADVTCITVLRRATRNPSETWLCPYTHETVVPPGLRITTSGIGKKSCKVGKSINQSINQSFLEWPKWHCHCKVHW